MDFNQTIFTMRPGLEELVSVHHEVLALQGLLDGPADHRFVVEDEDVDFADAVQVERIGLVRFDRDGFAAARCRH